MLIMLFLERRLCAGEDARVVIVVPTNVVANWMSELEVWLKHFTAGEVEKRGGDLCIVRPCDPNEACLQAMRARATCHAD